MPASTILISYPLAADTPVFPRSPPVMVNPHKSISRGESSNSSILTYSNHAGTHIDLPRHFCEQGAMASDLLSARCTFSPAFCIDISPSNTLEIFPEDLELFLPEIRSAEALLIRTGMSGRRDAPEYSSLYPFIDPAVPVFLRKNLPNLKILGIDTLSVAHPQHRDEGRACHQHFLCTSPPILILEDANLSDSRINKGPWAMTVFPTILGNLDAVPVVAILEPFDTEKCVDPNSYP